MNKLLSVADGVETLREHSQLPLDVFQEIVVGQGHLKNPARRSRDILRIFETSCWIARHAQNRDILSLTENFHEFIRAWNAGDYLLPMNQALTNYPPYARFLDCLKIEKSIPIPQRNDKESRKNLGHALKDKYDITFVAFDTFRTWAEAMGHAYRSPFEPTVYWSGNWDANRPSLESFKTVCREIYHQCHKTSGYANLGCLAHLVCQEMSISFQAFEMKMNLFLKTFSGEIKLASATIRRDVSGHCRLASIRPRSEVLKERASEMLASGESPKARWLEHRYLEDGMRVNNKLVKLIRWEESR